eukprot:1157842-Pelagomonas_calceolata.AAC.11
MKCECACLTAQLMNRATRGPLPLRECAGHPKINIERVAGLERNAKHTLRSFLCLCLHGHNLRVEAQGHHGKRCPVGLEFATAVMSTMFKIKSTSSWIANLRNLQTYQFQLLFSPATPSSASRVRDFMNQVDVLGITKLVTACCCDWAPFLLQLSCPHRQFSARTQLPKQARSSYTRIVIAVAWEHCHLPSQKHSRVAHESALLGHNPHIPLTLSVRLSTA